MHYLKALFQALDFVSIGDALLRILSVFICLVIHETSHGLAAYKLGDPTAKQLHRLSLNPFRHIDWLGLAMMFVMGFGWAKPVPVDMRYFKNPKQGMAITALAGPVSNFILAVVLIFISKGIYLYTHYTQVWNVAYDFLLTTSILSIGLGLFNLLPIPPLDGSKVVAVLLPNHIYSKLMHYERFGMIFLLVLVLSGLGDNWIGSTIYTIFTSLVNFIY